MKRLAFLVIALGLAAAVWYAFSPDGVLGYDEGVRLTAYTSRYAERLRQSSDDSAIFTYTLKYGDDQSYAVEFTEGQYCPGVGSNCSGAVVSVHVGKGRSGAGYGLGRSAAVPHRLELERTQGPIQVELRKHAGIVEVVGLR